MKPSTIPSTFQSTPSAWRETAIESNSGRLPETFQSTPSAWRETYGGNVPPPQIEISIHSLRMEGDCTRADAGRSSVRHFNPLPPHGGRRKRKHSGRWCRHFNPLPPHGGRLTWILITRMGVTFQSTPSAWRETSSLQSAPDSTRKFQSTPSAWRETDGHCSRILLYEHFNPLPPHGGRRVTPNISPYEDTISIHSLRMEGDSLS